MSHWDKNYDRKKKYFNARYPVVAEIVEEATYPKSIPDNQGAVACNWGSRNKPDPVLNDCNKAEIIDESEDASFLWGLKIG